MIQPIVAIRESILNAEDEKTLSRMTQIADIMAAQLDEIPERTKRRWKLAAKRAESRLQKDKNKSKLESKTKKK
tara:strand:+ start:94 stop:315 length:222 start_codon:yes stop_codon:yes gene_type:complete